MITYRTSGAWGPGKGANLTPVEVDVNFNTLDVRLTSIEDNPPTPNNISNITATGSQMTLFLNDGTDFTVTLPTAVIRFRGDFTEGTSYSELDLVSVPDTGLFLVLQDHIGRADSAGEFEPETQIGGEDVYHQVFGVPKVATLDDILDVEFDSGGINTCDVLYHDGTQWVTGPAPSPKPVDVSDTTLDLNITHAETYIRCSNDNGCVVRIPESGEVGFRVGTEIHFRQGGANPVTFDFSGSGDGNLNGVSGFNNQTAGQGAVVTLKNLGPDEWDIFGFLAEITSAG